MPADILLFAIITIVLVFWLRKTLGTRNGDERDRPNLFSGGGEKGNVIELPVSSKTDEGQFSDATDTDVEEGLRAIERADRSFDIGQFTQSAKDAFALIIESFAAGDRKILKDLLNEPVYRAFGNVISEHEERKETISTEIHSVRKAEIIEAKLVDHMAYLTVRFTADETCVIRDEEKNILSGHPDHITEMVDVWVFGRNVRSKNPAWLVCETRDEEPEDHKTPLPEAE